MYPGEALDRVIEDAILKNGSCGWVANVAGDNIITLYRLIRDISGHNFRPLGTLIVNVAADLLFGYTPIVAENYEPDIFCVAGDQLLSENPTDVRLIRYVCRAKQSEQLRHCQARQRTILRIHQKLAHNDWTLVYTVSTNDLLRSINSLNFFYTISLLATVFVIVLIGYAFAERDQSPAHPAYQSYENGGSRRLLCSAQCQRLGNSVFRFRSAAPISRFFKNGRTD